MIIVYLWSAGDLQAADQAVDAGGSALARSIRKSRRTRLAYLDLHRTAGRSASALIDESPDNVHIELRCRVPRHVSRPRQKHSRDIESPPDADRGESRLSEEPSVVGIGRWPQRLRRTRRPRSGVRSSWTVTISARADGRQLRLLGGDQDRVRPSRLFQPPMHALWTDQRFNVLLERSASTTIGKHPKRNRIFVPALESELGLVRDRAVTTVRPRDGSLLSRPSSCPMPKG